MFASRLPRLRAAQAAPSRTRSHKFLSLYPPQNLQHDDYRNNHPSRKAKFLGLACCKISPEPDAKGCCAIESLSVEVTSRPCNDRQRNSCLG